MMSSTWHTRSRVVIAARVFALATALGLAAGADKVSTVAVAFLALSILAAILSIPAPASTLLTVAPVAEGALVALILVALGNATGPLMVYLVIPPLVAGLQRGGKWPGVAAVAAEVVAVAVALVAAGRAAELVPVLERTGPWMVAGLGLAMLGSWMRVSSHNEVTDQAGYESAHRLLAQLRDVSRRLSSGLDVSALAEQLLAHTQEALGGRRALLLVRTDGDELTSLAGARDAFGGHIELDESVTRCWQSEQPQRRRLEGGQPPYLQRTVVPLRVGTRMLGVVVSDGPEPAERRVLSQLRRYLDEHSLRLETALLFDEIRSTATLEERHRLAREIHDGVAQEIASLGYLVDDLAANSPTAEAQQAVQGLRQELSRVVSELRLSIFDLRSTVSAQSGLGLALSDYAREVGKRGGLTVHLALLERSQRLHVHVETELLRIAQEAITNARKHARANNLWVTLNTESPIIMMRIEDDGIGSAMMRDDHFGLRIMQERAKRIGGELAVTPRPRGGTSVTVTVYPHSATTTPGATHVNLDLAR